MKETLSKVKEDAAEEKDQEKTDKARKDIVMKAVDLKNKAREADIEAKTEKSLKGKLASSLKDAKERKAEDEKKEEELPKAEEKVFTKKQYEEAVATATANGAATAVKKYKDTQDRKDTEKIIDKTLDLDKKAEKETKPAEGLSPSDKIGKEIRKSLQEETGVESLNNASDTSDTKSLHREDSPLFSAMGKVIANPKSKNMGTVAASGMKIASDVLNSKAVDQKAVK